MWILASSLCLHYKSEKGCVRGDKCYFQHVEVEGKPNKKSKKGGSKGTVAILKEYTRLGCVSQDSYPRKSLLREPGLLGSNHAVKFPKGTCHRPCARQTISYLLSFQGYLSIQEAVRLLQGYHKNRWDQMHTWSLETGLHQAHLQVQY